MPKKQSGCFCFEVTPEYSTAENEEVSAEIEVIANTFENVKVSGKDKGHRKVLIPLTSEAYPGRRVGLEIVLVSGYPYVAPKVRIVLPAGTAPDDGTSLSTAELETIKVEVKNNIEPCLAAGMPCMMQIASTVSSIVESPAARAATSQAEEAEKLTHSRGARSAGQSPTLTPVPLRASEALKLSLLTLHLLKKCCDMKNPESREEANGCFEWLTTYLLDTVGVLPQIVHKYTPWSGDAFALAFSDEIQRSLASTSERADLKKWLWEDEERTIKLQQGLEGRYQNEFIEQRLLGSGGFAPVYVCRKKIDGRLYAVKKIVMGEKQSEKIIREVQTLAALNHKNIVRYYDAWVEDGCDEELRKYIEAEDEEETETDDEENTEETSHSCQERATAGEKRGPAKTPHHCKPRDMHGLVLPSSSSSSASSEAMSTATDDTYSNTDYDESDTTDDEDSEKTGWTRKGEKKSESRKEYQTLYIQMELCSARSLRHLIEDSNEGGGKGLFSSERGEMIAAAILRQLLSVTAHTHHERIVHRDLKPDNVLFEMETSHADGEVGTIRVADFGLARVMPGIRRETSVQGLTELGEGGAGVEGGGAFPTGNCGSVLYCAPEQEKGLDYDFKVDEFSIGMIAFEMWLAVAGKDFRERFAIMNDAWRTGALPGWFKKWNPQMADVIGSLLEHDPQKRRSCEEVLNTADLPGDPADIVEALETIDRYGERIAGRVIQRIQRLSNQYRKPPPTLRDSARLLGSSQCADVVRTMSVIGMLHGSTPVPFYDQVLPMNPALTELGVESVVDSGGRSFCHATLPHYAVASFLGMQEHVGNETFHQFYHKSRPYAIFTASLEKPDVFNEMLLEPLLCLYHLLTCVELSGKVQVVVSHADWLSIVHPKEVGTWLPPPELRACGAVIESTEKVGPAISNITKVLAMVGLLESNERDELVRKYATAAVEAAALFGDRLAEVVEVVIDPALLPSDSLVNRSALDMGILVECRAPHGEPFAFGCNLDNFVSKCNVVTFDASAFSMVFDVKTVWSVGKHVRVPGKDGILLDGVAIRRQNPYSQAHMQGVIESAVQLWKGNILASLRVDNDMHAFGKALKARHIRWILLDGSRLVAASSTQQVKSSAKFSNIPVGNLRSVIRSLASEEKLTSKANVPVVLVSGKEEARATEEAKELYAMMTETPPSPLVMVAADTKDIEACLRAVNAGEHDAPAATELFNWLKSELNNCCVVPIFSSRESRMTLFVNQKRVKLVRKKEGNRKKK